MSSGEHKKPPPLPESEDRKIRAFQARAAPILAQHGGINVESQLKLRVVADELGLSDEELHAAVAASQSGGEAALEPEQRSNLERFSRNIVRSLRKQNRDVLTPQIERKLVEAGSTRYGLPEELARSTVRQIAAENGIGSISRTDAREFIAALVRQRCGEAGWIDQALRDRIYAEGKQWGLGREEVAELISRHSTSIRRRSRLDRLVLCSALLAVVAVGGLLAWMIIPRGARPPAQEPPEPTPAVVQETGPETAPPGVPDLPPRSSDWWDVDLAVAMGRARKALPDFQPVLENIQSIDPQKRGQAYEDVIGRLRSGLDDDLGRRVLQEILAGCYGLDPAEQNAARLRETLLAVIPKNGSELPEEERAYRDYFWVVETAVAALKREGIPAERSDAMAIALGQVVGQAVDRALPAGRLTEACLGALMKRFYRMLISLATVEPALAPARHTALMVLAASLIPPEARQRLDVEFLAAVLPGPTERWRDYVSLIRECASSPDVLNVLRMVDIYEASNNPRLQAYLRGLLLPRAGIRTDSKTVGEVARQVREALSADLTPGSMTPTDRWRLLIARSRRAIQQSTATAEQPERLLEEGVHLAGLSTLACALAQKELGYPLFDQLGEDLLKAPEPGDPSLVVRPGPGGSRAISRGPAGVLQQASRLVRSIDGYRQIASRFRISVLTTLAQLTTQMADLRLDEGEPVAEYLLAPKSDAEAREVAPLLRSLGRWRSVRLALADEVTDTKWAKESVIAVVSEVLGRDVKIGADQDWRQALRWALMQDVLAELPLGPASSNSSLERSADSASDAMLRHLGTQAQLLGITPDAYRAAATPAARQRLLIDRYVATLARRSLRPEDQAYLANLPYELTAIDYVGTSDVARTVLLGRVWLRLLSIGTAQQRPDRAELADRIAAEGLARQARATSVLVQFRDIQQSILEMWLLSSELP